jgi:hypothetical protein
VPLGFLPFAVQCRSRQAVGRRNLGPSIARELSIDVARREDPPVRTG